MIKACRDYLKTCLEQVGIKKVLTRAEEAAKHAVIPRGEIYFGESDLQKDGSLVARFDGPGDHERTYRRRTYQRTEQARVKIVHRDQDLAEKTRDDLIAAFERRIDDGHGNAILITAWSGEPEEDSSLLRQTGTTYIDLRFDGGIYRDRTVKLYDTATSLRLEGENK